MTQQIGSEKSSVAWFRLAECLKRKERERAFLLYRLLMHSFEDSAFLKKLEGDMWIDFDIQEATNCYIASAHYYKQRNEYHEAYLIYKKLHDIDSQNSMYVDLLLEVIDQTLFKNDKSLYCAKKLSLLCAKKSFVQANICFQEYAELLSPVQKNNFYQEIVKTAIAEEYSDSALIEIYLKKILEYFLAADQNSSLQQFLNHLEFLNKKWYNQSKKLLESF
jgi:hypothetical protein